MTKVIIQSNNFQPELQFVLVDETLRKFGASRFCYRGAIDGWMTMLGKTDFLEPLAKKFLPHLGQESFFELY